MELGKIREMVTKAESTTEQAIATINEQSKNNPMWYGIKECSLVDITQTEKGDAFLLVFADQDGNIMPSQFDGQNGNIYVKASTLRNFALSAKMALNLPNQLDIVQVLEELQKPHRIYFTIKSTLQQWGISFYNIIDWKETKKA